MARVANDGRLHLALGGGGLAAMTPIESAGRLLFNVETYGVTGTQVKQADCPETPHLLRS